MQFPRVRGETRRAILNRFPDAVYFRLDGNDIVVLAVQQLEEITGSTSAIEFERRVNQVMARGGLSHVAFFHGSAQRAPARYAINATFCAVDTPSGTRWMFELSGCFAF